MRFRNGGGGPESGHLSKAPSKERAHFVERPPGGTGFLAVWGIPERQASPPLGKHMVTAHNKRSFTFQPNSSAAALTLVGFLFPRARRPPARRSPARLPAPFPESYPKSVPVYSSTKPSS